MISGVISGEPDMMYDQCDTKRDEMSSSDLTGIKTEPISDITQQYVNTTKEEPTHETNPETLNSAVGLNDGTVSGYNHMSNSDGHGHGDCSIMMSVKEEFIDINYSDDVSTTKMEIKQEHTGGKPYSCSWCDTKFNNTSSLKSHMRIHTGEKPYSCSHCDKRFTQVSSLNRHMRIHTGEKPYSCSQCGMIFTDIGNLKRHKRIHTGEQPYSCSQCDMRFTNTSSLKAHMRIHTGENPYSCSQCDKSFTDSSNLKRHMKTHAEKKNIFLFSM